MRFQLNITLTEEDYLAFNSFHTLESIPGKKRIRKARTMFAVIMIVLAALVILILRFSTFSLIYAAFLMLFSAVYLLFYNKMVKRNIKAQVNSLKKTGKLPFDPIATFEFYEDKLVEITATKRVEQSYDALERICLVGDRYIFLYANSLSVYILPAPQIPEQVNRDEFLRFLLPKCSTVEYY